MTIRIELARASRRRYEQSPWWVEKEQIRRVQGPPDPSAMAQLVDDKGHPLAWGLYSPQSPRPFRAVSLAGAQGLPDLASDWLEQTLQRALQAREALVEDGSTNAMRLVNSEGDGLPGLTIDRFGDHEVVALSTHAMVARQSLLRALLQQASNRTRTWIFPQAALEREGVSPLPQASHDGPRLESLDFLEDGLRIQAPAPPSQKTGAYLDQRDNRRKWAQLLKPKGGVMLDVGSHVGGFSLHAARAGLTCFAIDQNQRVLDYVEQNAQLNRLGEGIATRRADMFSPVRGWDIPKRVDAVVFDPPKVARHPQERKKAMQAMRITVAQLWDRLQPGGHFAICSCSHHLGYEHLDRIMLEATTPSLSTPIARWGPGIDHPVPLCHEAGHYLRVGVYRK